ncbi:hypothetical protein [Lysobacter antibioticus]|nr:hypothetical protein [Lysobacter antibioticus]
MNPWLFLFVAAVLALALWRVPCARDVWRMAWMAVFAWGAPVCATYVGMLVLGKVMFGTGDCIGMPWLMMFPGFALGLITASSVLIAGLWIGFLPMHRKLRSVRLTRRAP